jgi:hypothetical protein
MMRQPTVSGDHPDKIAANFDSDVDPNNYDPGKWPAKCLAWYRDSNTASEELRANAVESLDFLANRQWREEELKARKGRPSLVIQSVRNPVEFLCGVQVQRRVDPVVLPFEPGDAKAAELMNYLLKWHGITSDEPTIDSLVFRDKAQIAIGFWKVVLDFDNDPGGEPRWNRPNALSIFTDPNWLDSGWDASKFVMHRTWMDLEEAADSFPEHRDKIKSSYGEWLDGASTFTSSRTGGGGDASTSGQSAGDSQSDRRLFWEPDTQRASFLEVWHKRRIVVPVAVIKSTGDAHGEPEVVERYREAMHLDPNLANEVVILRPVTIKVYCSRILGDICIDPPQASPFDEPCFPIFPTVYHYAARTPTSVIDDIKDPARWKNYAHSAMVEVIGSIAHSGWKNHKTKGADAKELREQSAGIGKVVNYTEVEPKEIIAPPIDQSLVLLMRSTSDMIPDISGVTRELAGSGNARTRSGRAVKALQQGTLTLHESVFDSFERDKAQATKFMVRAIQQYTPIPKAMRILGSLVARAPQGPEAQLMQDTGPAALYDLLNDALKVKFDVIVDSSTKPWDPTVAAGNLDQLIELAGQFPVPPNVMIQSLVDAGKITEEQAQECRDFFAQQQAMQAQAAQPH